MYDDLHTEDNMAHSNQDGFVSIPTRIELFY